MKMIKGKRQNHKNSSLDICMVIYSHIGSDNYLSLMNFALAEEDIQTMGGSMQNHRTNQKPKHIPLADMLRQRRTEMMQSQSYGGKMYSYNGNGYF